MKQRSNGNGRRRVTIVVMRLSVGREFAERFYRLGLEMVSNGHCEAKVAKRGAPALKEPGSWLLSDIRDNLDDYLGMGIAYLHLVEKASKEKHGKPSYFLVIKFRPDKRLEICDELEEAIGGALSRRYGELACFSNPDGSFIINATTPSDRIGRPMKLLVLPNRHLAIYNETTRRPHTLDRVIL